MAGIVRTFVCIHGRVSGTERREARLPDDSGLSETVFSQLGTWCSRWKVLLVERRPSCMALQSWLNAYMVFMRN